MYFICWYCTKVFGNEKVYRLHQRRKHFRCQDCGARTHDIPELKTHVFKLHRKKLARIPNAIVGRDIP